MATPIVDIHCHVFNADDLPVRGFLERLHLESAPLGPMLARLVDWVVQGKAPGFTTDMAQIQALLDADGAEDAVGADVATTLSAPRAEPDIDAQATADLAALTARDPEFVRRLGAQLELATATDPATATVELTAAASVGDRLEHSSAAAARRKGADSPLRGLRSSCSGWIYEATWSFAPGRCQVRGTRPRLRGSQTLPTDGLATPGQHRDHRHTAEEATVLDEVLDAFYAWCETEQVPITAHANRSNYAHDSFADFAGVEGWKLALQKFPELRVNLGHFGGAKSPSQS